MKKKLLFVFGTRPEAIKMAPLIKVVKNQPGFECKVCVTGQHRQMLDQVLDFFDITPEYDLQLMKSNQTLADITADTIRGVDKIIKEEYHPDYVVVQGDTTTAMAAAMAAFYSKVRIIHIEAGLRSHEKYSPYPEEMNRVLVARMADLHFAPTHKAVQHLLNEGIEQENIWNVGNTVIDALLQGLELIRERDDAEYDGYFDFIDRSKKIILVTGHRRENFGKPFENICNALRRIVENNPGVEIVYPVHLNPNVKNTVEKMLGGTSRIHLIEPLGYSHLIWLLNMSTIVITDSGGIQEEAPALGKPVLVMREVTERMEGVEAGTARLVGTDADLIVRECELLLNDPLQYDKMAKSINPYGDGTASRQIVNVLGELFSPVYAADNTI